MEMADSVPQTLRKPRPEASRRQAALQDYIEKAVSARKGVLAGSSRRQPEQRSQYAIPLGKMWHSLERGRGVQVRSYRPKKAYFHPDCDYATVLEEAKSSIFHGGEEGIDYYLSDSNGMPVCGEDGMIKLCNADSTTSAVKWTLRKYIELQRIYPSKLRLYCVERISVEDGSSGSESRKILASLELQDGTPTSPGELETSDSGSDIQEECDDSFPSNILTTAPSSAASAPFAILFAHAVPKKYGDGPDKYSFSTGVNQVDVLTQKLRDDVDLMMECRESLGYSNEDAERILEKNPLQLGFFLSSLYTGKECYDFIQKYDMVTGDVVYATPTPGAPFVTWSAWRISVRDEMALLVFVGLNGYHGVGSYRWQRDGRDLPSECYPLLYTRITAGAYLCTITIAEPPLKASKEFLMEVKDGRVVVTDGPNHVLHLMNASITGQEQEKDQPRELEKSVVPVQVELLSLLKESNCADYSKLSLIREIGRGSYGTVYLATWRGSMVAAKQLPTTGQCSDALSEAHTLKEIHHPNILSILGIAIEKEKVSIITNYVQGGNLHSRIFDLSHPRLSFLEKTYIAVQLAQALVYIHTETPARVHGDVKPTNVLVESGSLHVYLADFGLTRIEAKTVGTKTCQQGTPGFQPPEQLTAQGFDCGVDVYAFAGVLVELFGEKPLWGELLPFQIICKVVTCCEVPPYNHIDHRLHMLCQQCFQPHAERVSMVYALHALLALV